MTVFLLVFLGVLAIGGGGLLILDPSGKSIQFPLALLDSTPFTDYLLPGIILFITIGLLPLFITGLVLKRTARHTGWVILQGLILLAWLSIELSLNPNFFVPYMHYPLYLIGLLLLLLGWYLR